MLQITTGRFWGEVERFNYLNKADLFSVASIVENIPLPFGKLEPLTPETGTNPIASFTYHTGLPIPHDGISPGVHCGVDGREIEEQFIALLTICSARFWENQEETFRQLLDKTKHHDPCLPRLFEFVALEPDKVKMFFDKVLSLPRERYQAVTNAAIALHQAIRASLISYDAAFAMAVFALESLMPPEDAKDINWSHFPVGTRRKLDEILAGNEEIGDRVRKALLDDSNFKRQAKFFKLVTDNVQSPYFRSPEGARRSDFRLMLENAYSGRSNFVHALNKLERPLTDFNNGYLMFWKDSQPHFTLQGLIFLSFEVITNIVHNGPHLQDAENVPWYNQLSGITYNVPLAYESWLWRPECFQGNDMRERFSDVLAYLHHCLVCGAPPIDLREGIGTSVSRFQQLKKDDRLRVLSMILLWHWMTPQPQYEITGGAALYEQHKDWFEEPSIESLALHVWSGNPLPWELNVSVEEWKKYLKKRYKPQNISLPATVESAIQGTIANGFLTLGDVKSFTEHCNNLADDEGQRPEIVEHLLNAIDTEKPVDISLLLGVKPCQQI